LDALIKDVSLVRGLFCALGPYDVIFLVYSCQNILNFLHITRESNRLPRAVEGTKYLDELSYYVCNAIIAVTTSQSSYDVTVAAVAATSSTVYNASRERRRRHRRRGIAAKPVR